MIRGYWALCNGPSDDNLNVEALRTDDGGDESNTCITRARMITIHELACTSPDLVRAGQSAGIVTS